MHKKPPEKIWGFVYTLRLFKSLFWFVLFNNDSFEIFIYDNWFLKLYKKIIVYKVYNNKIYVINKKYYI